MQDDRDYNGYHCRQCAKPLSGQRRKWCNTKCQKLGIKPPNQGCQGCGNALPHGRSKWCTDQCNPSKAKKHGTWEDFQAALSAKAKNKFFCEYCGKESNRSPSGTARANGYKNRFCGMSCRSAMADRVKKEIAALHRMRKFNKPKPVVIPAPVEVRLCQCCGIVELKKHQRICRSCKHKNTIQRQKAYKLTDKGRAKKRANRLKRKALERGAKIGKAFDPFLVFKRDGWRCQMCGVSTPQKLRGTTNPNAPELDHITPLSKGGKHTMDNTQCSCRCCNIGKGAGSRMYQAGLFTGLIS